MRGLPVETEVPLPITYGDVLIEAAYRVDMIVDGLVLVENKSIQSILPIHEAQILTYLKLAPRRLGFLINWNVTRIEYGIHRIANRLRCPRMPRLALGASWRS